MSIIEYEIINNLLNTTLSSASLLCYYYATINELYKNLPVIINISKKYVSASIFSISNLFWYSYTTLNKIFQNLYTILKYVYNFVNSFYIPIVSKILTCSIFVITIIWNILEMSLKYFYTALNKIYQVLPCFVEIFYIVICLLVWFNLL